jgi:transposase InsO family protein
MPWEERSQMSERLEFVQMARKGSVPMQVMCDEFGISRKTGYKWLARYAEAGEAGLADRSRRPHHSRRKTSEEIEGLVLTIRGEEPSWGARKIAWKLQKLGIKEVPALSTITAILHRHGRITEEASQKRKALQRFERERPNELWQMDFKGHFGLGNGKRCHPLVLLDDHSRYCAGLYAYLDERGETVQAGLTASFRTYGLPEEMLMDNGSPWGNDRVHVYTPLVVWLIRLGIRVRHGRPRHPQTQGKLERLNRTLDEDLLQRRSFVDEREAQEGFDWFRPRYNHERPHEGLGMEVPASRYRPSERVFPETLPPIEYEEGDLVRKVQDGGRTSYNGREYRLPKAFRRHPVALRPTEEDGLMAVYFCRQRIAVLDLKGGVARPVRG